MTAAATEKLSVQIIFSIIIIVSIPGHYRYVRRRLLFRRRFVAVNIKNYKQGETDETLLGDMMRKSIRAAFCVSSFVARQERFLGLGACMYS